MASNISIALNVHSPKKDAVFATGAPTVGGQDVAIWAGGNISPVLTQSIVGNFHDVHNYAQTILKDGPASVSMPFGGADPNMEVDKVSPGADDITIFVGAEVSAKAQSHFLDRTFKRLVERWLEATKSGDTIAPAMFVGRILITKQMGTLNDPSIIRATGDWEGGVAQVTLTLTNDEGEQDVSVYTASSLTSDPEEILESLATQINDSPLYHAVANDHLLLIDPEADEYEVAVAARKL